MIKLNLFELLSDRKSSFCVLCILDCQGISTYDYIIALREQEQQGMGGQQSPQMSSVSSLTGLSSASSFNNIHRAAWCTPPRLFVEDQVLLGIVDYFSLTRIDC